MAIKPGGLEDSWIEPPTVDDPVLLQSHVQRANHHVRAQPGASLFGV
ncbi:hypothetical protein [Vitiosangium sp. GDMCC 1.1324]|nr:hypothetical protein [Vitiosangium sp. GDMCC 1.1324]